MLLAGRRTAGWDSALGRDPKPCVWRAAGCRSTARDPEATTVARGLNGCVHVVVAAEDIVRRWFPAFHGLYHE